MRLAQVKMEQSKTIRRTLGWNGAVFTWLDVLGKVGAVLVGVATLSAVGCGGTETKTDGDSYVEQTLEWDQGPGSEILQCHTFQLPNDQPIDVSRIQFLFGAGSHHVHIYRSNTPVPSGVADCGGGVPWPNWEMVVGAQTKPLGWKLPDGLTVPLAAHQQLLVQVHWLNVTAAPLHGQIKIRFSTASTPGTPVGSLFGVNKRVALGPHERQVLTQQCPLPEGAHILALMGHFHGLGKRYDASLVAADGTATSIYSAADESTLELATYEPPLEAPAGGALSFSCDYLNTREIPAVWGADTTSQEHCNVAAYYYPADDSASWCIRDFASSGTVTSLDVPPGELAPGDDVPLTVNLAESAPEDTLVQFGGDTKGALALGPFAVVPRGETSVVATAHALAPVGAAVVQAKVLDSQVTQNVRVGGLVLSEIMAWPGAEADSWVELANLGTVPIDLSGFVLATGGQTAGTGLEPAVPLTGKLEPLGCTVVNVNLGPGAAGGDGVALTKNEGGDGAPDTLFDALVWGSGNAHGLPDSNGVKATPVAAAARGQSLARRTMTNWVTQTPTPGICEVVRQ